MRELKASGDLPNQVRALGIRVEVWKAIAWSKGGKRCKAWHVVLQAGEGAVLEEIACRRGFLPYVWRLVAHSCHFWSHTRR